MKKLIFSLAVFGSIFCANAQEKVKEVVSSEYNRNSISVVVATRGNQYHAESANFANLLQVDDKFDVNSIPTKVINFDKPVGIAMTGEEADSLIQHSVVAKEIIGYIFNRQADGSMDDSLLRERGHYNATDQDIINAAAAKVNEQYLEWGEKLVSSSYVLLLDYAKIEESRNKNGEFLGYTAPVKAYVYKVDLPKEKLDEFYMTCWANPSDPAEAKAKAVEAFNAFEINLVQVATADAVGASVGGLVGDLGGTFKDLGGMFKKSSKVEEGEEVAEEPKEEVAPSFPDKSVEDALNDSYLSVIPKLENKISDWQVTVSIASVKPLKAKIGKKEGLKNGQRFRSYFYTEDKEGNLVSKKRGYLRATTVYDNRGYATGATDFSEFYQISGAQNIQEGWTIKQKNDIKLGVSLMGQVGGLSPFSLRADIDYLAHISKIGSVYPLVTIGLDPSASVEYMGETCSNFYFAVGAGYGLHALRWLEVMPYLTVGADTYSVPEGYDSASAVVLEPGLRIAFQVAYPVSLFLKGGYDLKLSGSENYQIINAAVKNPHTSGVFVDFGFRIGF